MLAELQRLEGARGDGATHGELAKWYVAKWAAWLRPLPQMPVPVPVASCAACSHVPHPALKPGPPRLKTSPRPHLLTTGSAEESACPFQAQVPSYSPIVWTCREIQSNEVKGRSSKAFWKLAFNQ